jgi:hypothetical protein
MPPARQFDRLLPLAGLPKRMRDAVRPRVELRIGKPITARPDGDRLWVTVDLLLETTGIDCSIASASNSTNSPRAG